MIFSALKFFIGLSNPDNLSLIYFQFILGCILFVILSCVFISGYFGSLCLADNHEREVDLPYFEEDARIEEEED